MQRFLTALNNKETLGMKKLSALLVVVGAVLVGGQFYSSKLTNQYLQQGSDELVRSGMAVDHKDIKKGFFRSKAQDHITFEFEGDEILATLDYGITHLPWGGVFDGTVEVQITTRKDGTQKVFLELLETQALISGHFNVFSGGRAELKVNPFDVTQDGVHLKMEQPLLMDIKSNLDGTKVATSGELSKLTFAEESGAGTGVIEGLKFHINQNGKWPDTDEMDAEGAVKLTKANVDSTYTEERFGITDLEIDIESAIEKGMFAYQINTNVGSFASKTHKGDYKGKGKGDIRLEGINVAPFQDIAKQILAKVEALAKAGQTPQEDLMIEAISSVVKNNMAQLQTGLEESLKTSEPKYTISNVDIESNIPDLESVSGDAELTLDTKAIDFAQLKEAVESGSPFAMMAFLEHVGVKIKAKGLPEELMARAGLTGDDELDVLLKEGTLTVNGEERPLF